MLGSRPNGHDVPGGIPALSLISWLYRRSRLIPRSTTTTHQDEKAIPESFFKIAVRQIAR